MLAAILEAKIKISWYLPLINCTTNAIQRDLWMSLE